MPDLDLYKIHGLNRHADGPELVAQLTAQLNAATDPLTRQRSDTARAILGDPARRARYDAHLDDPKAPPITEQTLAALAGRPAPVSPAGLPAAFSQQKARLMAVVAAAIGLVLIILVSAVACTGGSDAGDSTGTGAQQTQSSAGQTTTKPTTKKLTLDSARISEYTMESVPEAQLRIIKQVSLPDQSEMTSDRVRLVQPNEKTVRAYWNGKPTHLAADDYREAYMQSWVDLTIANDGANLTPNGQSGSEKVVPQSWDPEKPIPAGALKGVPESMKSEVSSGTFYFTEGTPGKYPWKASDKNKPHHRVVLSAIEKGDYVYLTIDGVPGVLIAELEKVQN